MSAVLFTLFAVMAKQNRYSSKSAKQVEINGQTIRGLSREKVDEFLAEAAEAKAHGNELHDGAGKYSAAMRAKGLI